MNLEKPNKQIQREVQKIIISDPKIPHFNVLLGILKIFLNTLKHLFLSTFLSLSSRRISEKSNSQI